MSKPGTLCQGMELLDDCEFIAIFDADFKPEVEFLVRSTTQAHANSKGGTVYCCQALQSASPWLLEENLRFVYEGMQDPINLEDVPCKVPSSALALHSRRSCLLASQEA